MRTKKEILNGEVDVEGYKVQELILEVLIDIRDTLAPPLERDPNYLQKLLKEESKTKD